MFWLVQLNEGLTGDESCFPSKQSLRQFIWECDPREEKWRPGRLKQRRESQHKDALWSWPLGDVLPSYARPSEELWEMHLRTTDVWEERGKHLSLSFHCPFVKVCLVGVNFPALPVYKPECLVRSHECMTKSGVPGQKAWSTSLSQWAIRLHPSDAGWSLCKTLCSAVAGIQIKAKMVWTGAHKYQACVSVRIGRWCCSNKRPHKFNGLQQQTFLFHSCYSSKVGLLWFCAIFFTPGPKLTKESPSGTLPVIVTWGKRLNLWTMHSFVKLLPGRDPHHFTHLSLTKACHVPTCRSKGWDL